MPEASRLPFKSKGASLMEMVLGGRPRVPRIRTAGLMTTFICGMVAVPMLLSLTGCSRTGSQANPLSPVASRTSVTEGASPHSLPTSRTAPTASKRLPWAVPEWLFRPLPRTLQTKYPRPLLPRPPSQEGRHLCRSRQCRGLENRLQVFQTGISLPRLPGSRARSSPAHSRRISTWCRDRPCAVIRLAPRAIHARRTSP